MMTRNYPDLTLRIGGHKCAGEDRLTQPVINPANGESLGDLPHATSDDIENALCSAADSYQVWRETAPLQRGLLLRSAANILRTERDTLASLISLELGKPLRESLREADTAAEMFEWAAEEGRRSYGRVIPSRQQGTTMTTVLEPIGPVVAFAGWNAPAITPARKISGALAAGCSIIIKPAEATPATALFLADALDRAGFPPGVLNMLFGGPSVIGDALLRSSLTRMVTFTGSIPVGKQLAALATQTMKRMVFELGGHAPVLVFDDADVEQVVRGAVAAKFRNSGQVCTSPTRFYVHERVFHQFVERFVDLASGLVIGDPFDDATQMGPLQNAKRVEAMRDLIADGLKHGAKVLTGGQPLDRKGFYFEPTVVTEVSDECRMANEEPFGPLAQISPFGTVEEGIAMANHLPVGLAAYVFSNNLSAVDRVTSGIEAGNVIVNHWTASYPETPFGGQHDSGIGIEGGIEGLQAFLQSKFISKATIS